MKKQLVILEMANNHMGDIEHAKFIISEFAKTVAKFKEYFDFAMKFQFRDYSTYIHPSHQINSEHKYVQRFLSTQLSKEQFSELKMFSQENGFMTICTAFDESSVDLINELGFDYIKIASCSFTDWPLLNKIVQYNRPIIASTATATLEDIDKVMSFLMHRNSNVSIMHCVGEYPTLPQHSNLNQIDLLKNRYTTVSVGLSSHESPNQFELVNLAIAKGATIFEKHIAIKTDKYEPNAYSVIPEQLEKWLESAICALHACGIVNERHTFSEKEISDVKQFKRGVFLKYDIKRGESVTRDKVYYAYPTIDGQLLSNDMSKYSTHTVLMDLKKDDAIMLGNIKSSNSRDEVLGYVQKVKKFLFNTKIPFPTNSVLEISHHYGLNKFEEVGISMITVVNREYCKKLIIVLPNQAHPEQYHNKKEETFIVLHGIVDLVLDGTDMQLNTGDVITIEVGQRHAFSTKTGCVIEEVSSTHYKDDSYYTDNSIMKNKDRKTFVTYWI